MIILKESKTAKIFQELLNRSKTADSSTLVSSIYFIGEKGIYITFEEDIKSIYLQNKEVDFNCCVTSNYFVTVLNAELALGDVNLNYYDDLLEVNGVSFPTRGFDFDDINETFLDDIESETAKESHITFTKEQWNKLEHCFKATASNIYKNPKCANIINFVINQGEMYKSLPNLFYWEISKFDANINSTRVSQSYGHDTKIFAVPYKIWKLLKDSDNVQLILGDIIYFSTKEIKIKFYPYSSRKDAFLYQLEKRSKARRSETKFKAKILDPIKSLVDASVKYAYEEEEDKVCSIEAKNGTITITVDEAKKHFTTDCEKEFSFSTNIAALNYTFSNISDEAEMVCDQDAIYFIDGDKTIALKNSD